MKTIAFFNNKGGVGKTSLVYHLAWMYANLGLKVVVADCDPQANLTAMFLDECRLEEIWPEGPHPASLMGSLDPIVEGTGDIAEPAIELVDEKIGLLVGDLRLSTFEDKLSGAWPLCLNRDPSAFRIISALYRIMAAAADRMETNLVLIDVGPNLGAINRAAIVAADFVVIPLAPDLFSLQGLRNLGPALRSWRAEWADRLGRKPDRPIALPAGQMRPVGYIVMQHAVRLDRPVKAYAQWMRRIPAVYRQAVLSDLSDLSDPSGDSVTVTSDPRCLATIKHYRSLMPLAMEARKPMFHLKPADGAIGAHQAAAQDCQRDFCALAKRIAAAVGIQIKDVDAAP